MSDFNEVKKNLIEPQARTYRLAPSMLEIQHLPRKPDGSHLFPLSLSQKGAGGNGDWESYRAAFEDFITHTDDLKLRLNDDTTKKLLEKLVDDYKCSGMKEEGIFFDEGHFGLKVYLLRYLHYVLFGLDPFDEEKMEIIEDLHYNASSVVYYLKVK